MCCIQNVLLIRLNPVDTRSKACKQSMEVVSSEACGQCM